MSKRLFTASAACTLICAATIYIVASGSAQNLFTFRSVEATSCDQPQTAFCDAVMPPIAGWNGHIFRLSQNYPSSIPQDVQPWLAFDPTTHPKQYLSAALGYFFEGNIRPDAASSFDPSLDTVRAWYNAPWQDVGLNGREFVHGLTRERVSRPGELAATQTQPWNNYAVGFYNAPGGLTIGRVWANHGNPNAAAANFPDGTVAAKLLFTTAPVQEVPYLQGSPEWQAYVFANPNDPNPNPNSPRAIIAVRLLQIDIAIKDARVAAKTGWVFGTFVYGGGPGGAQGSGWTNVAAVGEMWGNDPGYGGSGPLSETSLNPDVHMPHVGYQGRLNGPVDNRVSSCLSCHSTAEAPSGAMIPPNGADPVPWFRNIPSGVAFDPNHQSTDYSLQTSVGIANFVAAHALQNATSANARAALIKRILQAQQRPPRDGGPIH